MSADQIPERAMGSEDSPSVREAELLQPSKSALIAGLFAAAGVGAVPWIPAIQVALASRTEHSLYLMVAAACFCPWAYWLATAMKLYADVARLTGGKHRHGTLLPFLWVTVITNLCAQFLCVPGVSNDKPWLFNTEYMWALDHSIWALLGSATLYLVAWACFWYSGTVAAMIRGPFVGVVSGLLSSGGILLPFWFIAFARKGWPLSLQDWFIPQALGYFLSFAGLWILGAAASKHIAASVTLLIESEHAEFTSEP